MEKSVTDRIREVRSQIEEYVKKYSWRGEDYRIVMERFAAMNDFDQQLAYLLASAFIDEKEVRTQTDIIALELRKLWS